MTRHKNSLTPGWLPVAMGSLPHTDPHKAWQAILKNLAEVPGWPQLPKRAANEGVYRQFAERFPALSVVDGRLCIDRTVDLDQELSELYLAYLEYDLSYARINNERAKALALLIEGHIDVGKPLAIKSQITGPVSFGLSVVDRYQRPILYDKVMADAIAKHLRLKAAYLEQQLDRFASTIITIIEEPYMASFGSQYVSLTRAQVTTMISEVMDGIQGVRGIHCCGNTDWSLILKTPVELLSMDAYDYGRTLTDHAQGLQAFLERGGILCWGIVPAGMAAQNETVPHLVTLLEQHIERLVEQGVNRDLLLTQGMVSPSCGLGSVDIPLAEHILSLTRQVSEEMRHRYIVQEPVVNENSEQEELG